VNTPQRSERTSHRIRNVCGKKGIRFLLAGILNTGATLLLYWLLMLVLAYHVAYAISYVAGVLISYVLNSRYVFGVGFKAATFALYPLVYVAGYLAGAAVLELAVDGLGIPAPVGPLLAICVTLPLTYALTRLILSPADRDGQ
jgi:putative flippase GtrA